MACFVVPVTEAIVATVITKIVSSKEKKQKEANTRMNKAINETDAKIPFSKKLKWLSNLLWGGSVLLAFEHVWHGEVVPWFPFLTAAANPADAAEMLNEIATAGVAMSLLVTAVWLGMLAVSSVITKRAKKAKTDSITE